MECPSFTQVWGYDDLIEFQATQADLSASLCRTPALSFCPSCGIFLLDIGSTEAQRDAHTQACRDVEDPVGLEVVSEAEDSDDSEETASHPGERCAPKKPKLAACQDTPSSRNQENTIPRGPADTVHGMPKDGSHPELAVQRQAAEELLEAPAASAAAVTHSKQGRQVRGYHSVLHWQDSLIRMIKCLHDI